MSECACDLHASRRGHRGKGGELRAMREKLAALRAHLRDARARRADALAIVSERCRAERLAVRERVAAMRATAREGASHEVHAERRAARDACRLRQAEARAIAEPIAKARAERDAELAFRADMRRTERANRQRSQETPRTSRSERREESDDAVRANLPPELVAVFNRVKGSIRGSDRISRTEAFLAWAENHPSEVFEAIEAKTEAMIRDLERRERAAARSYRRAAGSDVVTSDDEIPF
jgi:hypothetical protein